MSPRPAEDLFEDTRMSFGEHLEELRGTLIRSLLGIAIGIVLGLMVADNVVNFLQTPLTAAIKKYHDTYALEAYEDELGFKPPELQVHVSRDGLAPQRVMVDPGQLVQAIRMISPESLKEIELTPYQFSADSILPGQAAGLARWLARPESADDAVRDKVAAIASALSPATHSQLESLADSNATAELNSKVVDALNEVIEDRTLHGKAAFDDWLAAAPWSWSQLLQPATPNQLLKMKEAVDRAPEDDELSRRLNRVLVARTFPEHVEYPQIRLAPLEIWQYFSEGTQALSPHEVFMVWIKAAIVTGLIISAPWVFYQIWLFVAAGLYPHEQKYVYLYLPISLGLFAFGVCLAFFFVFDPVLQFLFSFNANMGIKPQLRIGEWLSFVMFMPLGFGIAFQLPLVMLFLQRVGLVSIDTYISQWRIAVLIISVLSMILTPADPMSMIMLGVPLTVLYFFGIGLCRWMPARKNPFGETPPSPV